MDNGRATLAIDALASHFFSYDWTYRDVPGAPGEKYFTWPGPVSDEIMVCAFKGNEMRERFHRQDYFFFNYAYRGGFDAISYRRENRVTIGQGDLYVGQPFTGYAIEGNRDDAIVILGVLIQKDTFFRSFLPIASADARLLHFFLDPQSDARSDDFLHLHPRGDSPIHTLVQMMAVEYAEGEKGSQEILKSLALALIMYTARQYQKEHGSDREATVSDQVVEYMVANLDNVTLNAVAKAFGYNPNYLSALIRRETGVTYSQLLLRQRMKRAEVLLDKTGLSVEEVSAMVGYSSTSNFYRAFKGYFGKSPRDAR